MMASLELLSWESILIDGTTRIIKLGVNFNDDTTRVIKLGSNSK
jgi:hypothetical protein